jgi:hypothetical protein
VAKAIYDEFLDLMLDQVEGTQIHICNAQPLVFADLGTMTLASGVIGAPTAGAGSPSGRNNTFPGVQGMSVTADGAATHVALSDNISKLYLVTTCPVQTLTTGGTVDTTTFVHTLRAPA